MKKANLYFGIVLFVVFLITGYYLEIFFKPQNFNNLVLRMEIRANHVYIIFISLLNIISFKCELSNDKKWTTYLDSSFKVLLILSGGTAIYAFMYNHNGNLNGRNWTLLAVVLSLSSIVMFLTNELIYNILKNKTRNR
jgi:uncharacterized membrane protein